MMLLRAGVIAVLAVVLDAADWPQFLGPARDGVYPGTELAAKWPPSGPATAPPVVWRREIGQGFSAPVVARGRLILFHRKGNTEVVEALDAATGKTLWSFEYATSYRDDFGFDEGPRATPTISGDHVYTFGAEGMLHCLDFSTGKKVWSLDVMKTFGVRKGYFGAAGSPLLEGDRLLLNAGGPNGAGIVALDAKSGKTLWQATSDDASYSSPVAATIRGTRHALFFTRAGLVDADAATGKLRFQFPWRSRSQASVNAAAPLVIGEMVFLSASYGTGAVLLEIGDGAPKKLWSSDDVLSNHYATSVHRDGFLYGFHGRQEEGQALRCVELRTGKVRWSIDRFGAGSVTLAGGLLFVQREDGELVLAPATPDGFKPTARAQVLPATIRSYPAIADGRYYVRNERALICLNLAATARGR